MGRSVPRPSLRDPRPRVRPGSFRRRFRTRPDRRDGRRRDRVGAGARIRAPLARPLRRARQWPLDGAHHPGRLPLPVSRRPGRQPPRQARARLAARSHRSRIGGRVLGQEIREHEGRFPGRRLEPPRDPAETAESRSRVPRSRLHPRRRRRPARDRRVRRRARPPHLRLLQCDSEKPDSATRYRTPSATNSSSRTVSRPASPR